MSLRDKVEGNELDLSLNQLVDVPVKELAAATRATHLDLSCNHILSLPNTFATLTHLVKIDLSRNKLTELPDNFGNLIYLNSLDLYGNQIFTLPLSFCRLKNLKWLDLKSNPLNPELKTIAGDCLDTKQCQQCAKSVVSFMQSIESSIEQDKQRRLKEEREKEAIRRAQAEKELEEQRRKKKAEKEKRKAEIRAKREKELLLQTLKEKEIEKEYEEIVPEYKAPVQQKQPSKKSKEGYQLSALSLFLFAIPFLVVAIVGFGVMQGYTLHEVSLADFQAFVMKSSKELWDFTMKWCGTFVVPYAYSIKSTVMQWIHSSMIYVTEFVKNLDLSSFK